MTLHDASLLSIEINWAAKTTKVTFKTHPDNIVYLVTSGTRQVEVPHAEPWGPSISVNEVRETEGAEISIIEVEMQSGDTIKIEACSFFGVNPSVPRIWHVHRCEELSPAIF
jgi:hypothetical protein